MAAPSCAHCEERIEEETVARAGELALHEACLACSACRSPLAATCYTAAGRLYCRADYARLTEPRCAGCRETFGPGAEGRTLAGLGSFHLACFRCAECELRLEGGMLVGAAGDRLLCQDHFTAHQEAEETQEKEEEQKEDTVSQFPESPKSENEESDKENEDKEDKSDKKECKDGKRRGPRTNITAKQLEMLRTVFNQTPKPTRQVREQLAKDTQLPMRVIQVWFQNKRSKEKRMHALRFMGGGFPNHPLHPMFAPPNAIAYNYGPAYGHPAYPPEYGMEFGLEHGGCFPSPPTSDCASPEYQFEY